MDPQITVIALAFFVTVIALASISHGQWDLVKQAIKILGDSLKKVIGIGK